MLRIRRPSVRMPLRGPTCSPINLHSAFTHFLLRYSCPSLMLCRLDKERRWTQETCSALLRTSMVTRPAPAPSAAPLLLHGPLHHQQSPALLLPLLHRVALLLPEAAFALRPASPDDMGVSPRPRVVIAPWVVS
jgi:hypothetical protein